MTVAELMTLLATLPADAVVRFPDTYVREEGWEDGHATATCVVGGATLEDGSVVFYEGDEDEDDWDEEDWDEEE